MGIYVFSPRGLKALKACVQKKPLAAFDLDGTLVPLHSGYGDVRVERGIKKSLRQIAGHIPVAVVSGRGKWRLERIFKEKKLHYVGDHGLEGARGTLNKNKRKQYECRVQEIKKYILENFRGKGLVVEDKKISLTLLFGKTLEPEKHRNLIAKSLTKYPIPHRIILGKKVLNWLPSVTENKGTAVLKMKRFFKRKAVIYIGDDTTDEDVFALLDKNIFTVKVGRSRKTQAQYYLKDQSEMGGFLLRIQEFLMPSHLDRL